MRVKMAAIAVALGAIVTLSGCGVDTFASAAGYKSTPQPKPMPTTSTKTLEPVAAFAPEQITSVAHPWHPGDFQKGLQILWNTKPENVKQDAQRMLDYVVQLGANSVGLSFPVYVDGLTPTTTYAGPDTPTVRELRYVVRQAKRRKLRVALRPIVSFEPKYGTKLWVGSLDPIPGWFTTYGNFLAPYLQMADKTGVDEFVLGNDLVSLQQATDWPTTIGYARQFYSGELSFTMNTYAGKKPTSFDNLGLNMYPSLPQLHDNATIADLTKALAKWLAKRQTADGKHVTLNEVAIAGRSNAYIDPQNWASDQQSQPLPQVQSKWFAAAYEAARQTGANGIYFWGLNSAQQFGKDLNQAQEPLGDFVGRDAERAIQLLFSHD